MLDLSFEVGEDSVLLKSVLVCHVFDDVVGLFRAEVWLLVRDVFLALAAAPLLVFFNLFQDVILVFSVGLVRI